VEVGVGLALVWIALHVPAAAPPLLVAAGLILVWALLADGPVGVVKAVAFRIHRVGLMLMAVLVAALPVVTGRLTDLTVLLPCLGAAAVLLRVGLISTPPRSRPGSAAAAPAAAVAAAAAPAVARRDLARGAGRIAARAERVVNRAAGETLPRQARLVGRVIGRSRNSSSRGPGPDDTPNRPDAARP
jgi:hypothetical protein